MKCWLRHGHVRRALHLVPFVAIGNPQLAGQDAPPRKPRELECPKRSHSAAFPRLPRIRVSLQQAARVWVRVALLSFGGPAGQIAVMHRILVEEKRWISEERFLHALNYCMLLPGPEAQQLATYIGWLMHRTLGGIVAGGLFVVPGIIAIMALSYVYAGYGNVPVIAALFFGLKAAVLAIVLEAVVRIGKRALKNRAMIGLAARRIHRRSSFSPFRSRSSFSARRSSASSPGCRTAARRRVSSGARALGQEERAGNHRSHARRANCPNTRARPSPAACVCPPSGSRFGSFR